MLSRSDRKVAARDPGLPMMPLLLDEEDFAGWLREHPGGEGVLSARCHYLRYKPGVRLLAGYELALEDGRRLPAHAWGTSGKGLAKLEKEGARPEVDGFPGPGRLVLPSRNLLVEFYPNDRRLPALAEFVDPQARSELMSARIPSCAERSWTEFRILSYKPERRFVGALQAGGEPGLVVRGFTEPRFSRSLRAARSFRCGDGFRFPELRGFSRSRNVLVVEWLSGRTLTASVWAGMGRGDAEELALLTGWGLAELHAQPAPPLRSRKPRRESRGLSGAARGVEAVLPGRWGRRARRIAGTLKSALDGAGGRGSGSRPIHGDFHPEQILQSDDGLALLDLDRADRGDPMADLATFSSHLERWVLERSLPGSLALQLEEGLIEGYREAGGPFTPDRYALQRSAALLRLAPQPFRERSADWPSVTRSLLQRAESLLPGRPVGPRRPMKSGVAG